MAVALKGLTKVGRGKGKGNRKVWPKYRGRAGKQWASYLFTLRFGDDGRLLPKSAQPAEIEGAKRLDVAEVLVLFRKHGLGQAPATLRSYLSQAEREPSARASWFKWDGVSDGVRDDIISEIAALDPKVLAKVKAEGWEASENVRCRDKQKGPSMLYWAGKPTE